jgi:predicted CxxxxCH...CXXCH cytochrome family protein
VICHKAVVATFDPGTNATTWANRTLHVNGVKESNAYHDLANWTSPKGNQNHHGSRYFLTNQQRDEHNVACTQCHGASLNGGSVGVSCSDTSANCHNGKDWRGCTFCHGTPPAQNNPPVGVDGETTTGTMAVGRHVAHLTASATHAAFACGTCHVVPAAGDVSHAMQYLPSVPSGSIAVAGHHGDVTFTAPKPPQTLMAFNVNATQGNPVTARGTCIGACHSNGRGGAPAITPYWAGGTWPTGSCTACHAGTMNSLPSRHGKHAGENLSCTSCHPPATGGTHMNGQWDVSSTISGGAGGGSVTTTGPGGPCGADYSCTGNCHGKQHNNLCWRP